MEVVSGIRLFEWAHVEGVETMMHPHDEQHLLHSNVVCCENKEILHDKALS